MACGRIWRRAACQVNDDTPLPADLFEQQAQRRVSLGLILGELVQDAQPHAKPEQVRAVVEEQAQSYEQPEEVVNWFYQRRSGCASSSPWCWKTTS